MIRPIYFVLLFAVFICVSAGPAIDLGSQIAPEVGPSPEQPIPGPEGADPNIGEKSDLEAEASHWGHYGYYRPRWGHYHGGWGGRGYGWGGRGHGYWGGGWGGGWGSRYWY
ncbi:protein FAM98B-like [Athalia rosae]|uniref:protein FAM98B-like n=1 Tax=Athalia rosae TaxID=37344 RepID=UPI0020343509|nr:protein FAM98B-like [Athalia rosae]